MKRSLLIAVLLSSLAWAQTPSVSPTPDTSATPATSASPAASGTPAPGASPVLSGTPAPGPSPANTMGTDAMASPTPTTGAPKGPEDPAHAQLRELKARMQASMNNADIEGLLDGVTEDVVFSTMNGDVVRGKDGIRDYFKKMMGGSGAIVKSVTTNFEADDLTILYGGSLGDPEDAGVAWGHSTDSYTLADGSHFAVQPRWTATMIREPDGWKVASFHYSVSMFDNPILDKLKKSSGLIGGAGLVVGLLLGLFFGHMMGRRKK